MPIVKLGQPSAAAAQTAVAHRPTAAPSHSFACCILTMQIADPLYGEWLDVYLTLLQPLVPPVTGLLGECRRGAVGSQNGGQRGHTGGASRVTGCKL